MKPYSIVATHRQREPYTPCHYDVCDESGRKIGALYRSEGDAPTFEATISINDCRVSISGRRCAKVLATLWMLYTAAMAKPTAPDSAPSPPPR